MLAQLTRRAFGLGVSIFATLGFLAVPLGNKTGFQHVRAIVVSGESQRFLGELARAAGDLKRRLGQELRSSDPTNLTNQAADPPRRRADQR